MTQYEPIFFDIETTGLNPMAQHWWDGQIAAQVTAIGMGRMNNWRKTDDPEELNKDIQVLYDGDEYRLLQVFRDRLSEWVSESLEVGKEPFVVGWNSRNYDHPYIGARYARKRLGNNHINNSLKRLDMMRPLGNDDVMAKNYPSQDDYAEALGIEVYDELDGSDMPKAFERNQWEKIDQHVRADVDVMMSIFAMRKAQCMEEFYNHYDDVDGEPPKFIEEADF